MSQIHALKTIKRCCEPETLEQVYRCAVTSTKNTPLKTNHWQPTDERSWEFLDQSVPMVDNNEDIPENIDCEEWQWQQL
jgi:hypothetical protein